MKRKGAYSIMETRPKAMGKARRWSGMKPGKFKASDDVLPYNAAAKGMERSRRAGA